jgi:hypothetical protein
VNAAVGRWGWVADVGSRPVRLCGLSDVNFVPSPSRDGSPTELSVVPEGSTGGGQKRHCVGCGNWDARVIARQDPHADTDRTKNVPKRLPTPSNGCVFDSAKSRRDFTVGPFGI